MPNREPFFTQETRSLFKDNFWCWVCRLNIWGPGYLVKLIDDSNSPLNAAHVCNEGLHRNLSDEEKGYLLNKTVNFLRSNGYQPNKTDLKFLEKHKNLYELGKERFAQESGPVTPKTVENLPS